MKILYILKDGPTEVARKIIDIQSGDKSNEIKIIDLSKKELSYERIIDEIFSHEKVVSW